jgi:phosphopantothenoylcysteine synthetase/decarboxylase
MKSSGKKSLHKLVIDDEFDHQFFGIVSSEADYKVCLEINNKLGISLANSEPASRDENKDFPFARYMAKSRYNDLSYQLVSNKSGPAVLSKNYPSLDYLFLICGSLNDKVVEEAQKKIRETKETTAVFLLEAEKLSDEYLVLQTS